jgi:hypothetical protein
MKTLKILWVACIAGAFLVPPSCSDSSGDGKATQICKGWCESELNGLDDCLDDMDCYVDDKDEEIDKCADECLDTLKGLERTDLESAYECLECIPEHAGSDPSCEERMEAYSDCDNDCNDNGAEEFFDDFDYEADIGCSDSDIDTDTDGDFCPGYTGSSSCCMTHDPCDWANDDVCDCQDTCWWDADDCYDYYYF